MPRRRIRTSFPRLLALVASIAASSCEKSAPPDGAKPSRAQSDEASPGAAKGQGARRRSGPISVRLALAERRLAPRLVSAVAALTGRSQAEVYAKVVGRLAWIGPPEGRAVKVNEVLFRVDRSDPGERFLSVPVVSPIKGWVGRWHLQNVGEQVTTTAPVVTIVDDQMLRAQVHLSTADWIAVDDHAKATVELEGDVRKARIASVARAADATSARGSVIVEIPNDDLRWRAGMVARIRLELEPKQRMLMPATALTITDRGAFVFAVVANKAHRHAVSFRLVDADTVEVLDGLPEGSHVVVAGGNLLTDGADVKVQDEKMSSLQEGKDSAPHAKEASSESHGREHDAPASPGHTPPQSAPSEPAPKKGAFLDRKKSAAFPERIPLLPERRSAAISHLAALSFTR